MRDIWIDSDSISDELSGLLLEVLKIGSDYKVVKSIGADFINNLNSKIEGLRRRISDDFSIVIIGNFKRGKSTFINALLKEEIVPTNVTPETVTINEIIYGDKFSITAILEDGRNVSLEKHELFRDELEKVSETLPSNIHHVEITIPDEEIRGIRIVDTPGLGDILKQFDRQINDYLKNADSIIYLVSALSPFSEDEQAFLRACIVPQEFSRLFVPVNMMDSIENIDDYNRLLGNINEKINKVIPDTKIYGISAMDEVCRLKGNMRPNHELQHELECAFDDMRNSLRENIFAQHELLKLQRITTMLDMTMNELNNHIYLLKNSLQMNTAKIADLISQYESDSSEVVKRLEKYKQTLHMDIQDMYSEATSWMDEFFNRIEKETIPGMKSCSLEGVIKNFHFFMVDTIREAVTECINYHTREVLYKINAMVKEMDTEFKNNFSMKNENTVSKATFVDVSWTDLDMATGALTVAASFVPGFSILASIGQLVLGIGKGSMGSKQLESYVSAVSSKLPEIKNSILKELKVSYGQISEYACKQLDEGYKNQIEASLEAVKQAQKISSMGEENKKEIMEGIEIAQFFADSANKHLKDLEKKFMVQ